MVLDMVLSIIGVDLLSNYVLVVKCGNNSLLDGFTSLSTAGVIAPISSFSVKVIAESTEPDSFMEVFPGLTKPAGSHRELQLTLSITSAQQPAAHL